MNRYNVELAVNAFDVIIVVAVLGRRISELVVAIIRGGSR